jgi:hypothetical protein
MASDSGDTWRKMIRAPNHAALVSAINVHFHERLLTKEAVPAHVMRVQFLFLPQFCKLTLDIKAADGRVSTSKHVFFSHNCPSSMEINDTGPTPKS